MGRSMRRHLRSTRIIVIYSKYFAVSDWLQSVSMDNILLDLHNYSHPSQPHSIIANYEGYLPGSGRV